MSGLLLIRANPFHLQALEAAPVTDHPVRSVILQPSLHALAMQCFSEAEVMTYPSFFALTSDAVPESLIAAVAPHEAETLLMIDRANRWGASLMATRSCYLKLLGQCSRFLRERSFDGVVFHDAPQHGFDYIIYLLAQLWNIPVAIVGYTQLRDRITVQAYLEEHVAPPSDLPPSAVSSEVTSSDYMREGVVHQRSTQRHSANSRKLRPVSYSPVHLLKRLRRDVEPYPVGIPDQTLGGTQRLRLAMEAKREHARAVAFYKSVSMGRPSLDDYVFFPLQFQPEATTLPRAGYMLDQVNYARMLSSALPDGWRLAIKEHPASLRFMTQIHRARGTQFYRELHSLPNVDLLDLDCDTDAMIDGCRCLVTGTGTPGWEAVNRGRPAVVFGWPWYLGSPGVFRATDTESLRDLFRSKAGPSGPSQNQLQRFIAWFMAERTAPGTFGRRDTTNGFEPEQLRDYSHAIENALTRGWPKSKSDCPPTRP